MFDTMDGNKDGKVTAVEMEATHQRVTGSKATKSNMSAADKIKVVDTDGDRVLTAEEHAVGSRAMFQKMDTDKDGFLTKDVQLRAATKRKRLGSRWAHPGSRSGTWKRKQDLWPYPRTSLSMVT